MPDNPSRPQKRDDKISDAELAYLDDLTGLYNRRYLSLTLPKELAKVKDKKSALSLFMIDFDDFKAINDTYGHLNGDKVLVEISNILKKEIGREGIFLRYAGDEFTVLLSGKSLKEAILLGTNLLAAVSAHKLELKSGKKLSNISFSVGVATYPEDADTAENLIDKADQALYTAKRMGKNRLATAKDIALEAKDRDMVQNALPCKKIIGREKEREALKKIYASASEGARKYAIIRGRDGIGKTRLMFEVFRSEEISPKGLVLKCSREEIYQEFGAIVSALNDFLGYFEIKDPKQAETEIFNAIVDISVKTKTDKFLFLIDDIVWIDNGSLKIIERVLKHRSFNSVVVVATLPTGDTALIDTPFLQFAAQRDYLPQPETIELGPLSENSVSELLKTIFSGPIIPSELEKKIHTQSGGSPAAIEEIIKYMLKKKIIYPKMGKWVFDEKSLGKMPESMNELLNSSISELDEDAKDLLKKAAVMGSDFNIDILKSLYGKNEGELIDMLDKLKKEGILGHSGRAASGAVSFVNNVIRESIYNSIKKSELQKMHKRIAGLIKEYYKSETSKAYGEVKYHMEEAGEEAFPAGTAEMMPSAEEVAERPLSEKSARIAPNIVILLRAAWLNSNLYPLDNRTCVDSIENLYSEIRTILDNDPTLTITVSREGVLVNGERVSRKKLNIMLARALEALFEDYGISSITFKKGMPKKELESLLGIFIKKENIDKPGAFAKVLTENDIRHIKIDEVKYRKASDYRRMRDMKDGALAKSILENPVLKELLSIGEGGMTLSEKALHSISGAIADISGEAISEKDKMLLIVESLNMAGAELSAKDRAMWDREKKSLTDVFLSMEPGLRTKIIEEGGAYESGGSNFIYDILSSLDDETTVRVLKEGYRDSSLSPEDLRRFLTVIMKSQSRHKVPCDKIADLFKKAGIDKEAITKALEIAPTDPFFEELAKEFMDTGKSEALDSKYINNLRPLTEALAIKNDKKTIADLIGSLTEKLGSDSPAVRSSAAEGLGRISDVLLEKEFFDTASGISATLAARLKAEDNSKVYAGILKSFESIINTLIQKQRPPLLVRPLALLKEEAASPKRSAEFKRYVNAALSRALSVENMNILLLSLKSKAGKDYAVITEILSAFKDEIMPSLIGVLAKRDEMKWDPFEVYVKKQNVAVILKKMGDDAITRMAGLLSEKKPLAAQNAAEVFGHINDIRYLPYMEQAAVYPDKEVRKTALEVIKKMRDGDTIVKALVNVLPKERDPELISRIIDAISELANRQFVPYIKNELKGRIRLDDYDKLVNKLNDRK
ncbi:MAG: diguanylate cyclase [Candidatus Omnitrophota bacterium]